MDHYESNQSVFSTPVSIGIVDQHQTGEYESIADFRRGSLFRMGEGERRGSPQCCTSSEERGAKM